MTEGPDFVASSLDDQVDQASPPDDQVDQASSLDDQVEQASSLDDQANPEPDEPERSGFTTTVAVDSQFREPNEPGFDVNDPLDDNFDEVIKGQLSQPTDDDTVENADPDDEVILWRGGNYDSVSAMKANGSAGGKPPNPEVGPPSRDDTQRQVGSGGWLPEFTTSKGLSGFGWRNRVAVVAIQAKYLTRGSDTEQGWIADPAAPLRVLQTVDRRVGLPELAGPNAS